MANKKISQLTAIVTVDTAADLFPIVDTSAIETKSITPSALKTALSLNNVDNTTDANKPVSTATQTALNAKQDTLVSATNIKTINSTSILGSGNIVVGATPSGIAGAVQFSDGSAFSSDATNLFWDDTNNRLGIGTSAPSSTITTSDAGGGTGGVHIKSTSSYAALSLSVGSVSQAQFGLQSGATQYMFYYNPSSAGHSFTGKTFISDSGFTAASAMLHIKGSGSTSATTALLVQNSAGTQLLNIRDDGFTTIGQSNQGISTHNLTATNYIVCGSTSSHYFQLGAGLVLRSPSDGVATFLNGAESGFTRINLGGTTSSFPAIKRALNNIEVKNADDTYGGGLSVGAALNTSAILQADSTTKGFLPPRMTTTQRNAISSPAEGLMIYNTTTAKLNVYTTAWEAITSL